MMVEVLEGYVEQTNINFEYDNNKLTTVVEILKNYLNNSQKNKNYRTLSKY